MGSGKSTIGALVAARAGVPHHDLDAMIEASCGQTIAELFSSRGEAAFRALERRLLPAALEPGAVASLGGGAPLPAASWALIRERALSVWLDAPLETLLERAGEPAGRPLLAGGPAAARKLYAERLARYARADHRVDVSGAPEAVAEEVWRLWLG